MSSTSRMSSMSFMSPMSSLNELKEPNELIEPNEQNELNEPNESNDINELNEPIEPHIQNKRRTALTPGRFSKMATPGFSFSFLLLFYLCSYVKSPFLFSFFVFFFNLYGISFFFFLFFYLCSYVKSHFLFSFCLLFFNLYFCLFSLTSFPFPMFPHSLFSVLFFFFLF